ncbi:MAG: hypothetical protein ACFE8N_02490 [Promethearchaeota archaeon]
MINDNILKIALGSISLYPPSNVIGIDMGQTLTKISYVEKKELYLVSYPTLKNDALIRDFLNSKINYEMKLNFTGGKSYHLYMEYSKSHSSRLIDEFEAIAKGIEILYLIERKRELKPTLIVNIGTGTSMISKKDSIEHLGGTAMGGGFLMGLMRVLFNINDFQELMSVAKIGTRYNVDLKVSDIYDKDDYRIDHLFREFTAASLGKINQHFDTRYLKKEDFINSVICMIGESVGSLATLMAENNDIDNIVFCGGFLKENKIAKRILSLMSMLKNKNPIFMRDSEFSASIGALYL